MKARVLVRSVVTTVIVLSSMVAVAPSASAATCKSAKGTIVYNDLFTDIYSISETARWCWDRTLSVTSVNWSRSWERYNILYSWAGWVDGRKTSGTAPYPQADWKQYYSRGDFALAIPPGLHVYPDITMRVYAGGSVTCTGHPFDGANVQNCKVSTW
jgi:hypothetical protein